MAKKQVVNGDASQNVPNKLLPISLNIKVEGKSSYKDGDGKEITREFEFKFPCNAEAENIDRVYEALINRKFKEFISGLKSRGELATMTDEEVVARFCEFMERWMKGEKATRTVREFSLTDAAELVLVSYFRRQGASEKDAKQKAKDARKEGGELWQKALKKVQEDF